MSNDASTKRLENAIDTLNIILNSVSSEVEETYNFRNISHLELCRAVKYWIEQLRILFGESISVEIVHGYNEDGIDLFIDLLNEKQIRFAVQIKSYEDIKDKHLNDAVHAQIGKSKKHILSRLVFAFAGDLNNETQEKRISIVLSEIHKINAIEPSISFVSPREFYTIYKVYKEKGYPVDYLNLNLNNIITLANSISHALTNEKRKAIVSIKLEYPINHDNNAFKVSFSHGLKEEGLALLDRIENLKEGEHIVIPKDTLTEFNIYEGEEKIFDQISDLTIIKSSRIIPISFYLLDPSDEVLNQLINIPFKKNIQGDSNQDDVVILSQTDELQPLRIKIEIKRIDKEKKIDRFGFSFDVEVQRNDVVNVLSAFEFLRSLETATSLKCTTENNQTIVNQPIKFKGNIDPKVYDLFKRLSEIQKVTGTVLKLPDDFSISWEQNNEINEILGAIRTGKIEDLDVNCEMELSRITALQIIDNIKKKNYTMEIPYKYQFNILGKEINLGDGVIVPSNIETVQNMEIIEQEYLNSSNSSVKIRLKMKGTYYLNWFRKKSNSK